MVHRLLIAFFFLVQVCYAQCTVTIKQLGKKNPLMDEVNIVHYDVQPVRTSDSTLVYNFKPEPFQPEYIWFLLENKHWPCWQARAWIDPKNMPNRTLVVNYDTHTIKWENPTQWDSITQLTDTLEYHHKQRVCDSLVIDYVVKNSDSFLSLWFFGHTSALGSGGNTKHSERLRMFNNLNPNLKEYPEYKEIKNSFPIAI